MQIAKRQGKRGAGFKGRNRMSNKTRKERLEKSLKKSHDVLIEKAEDCSDLAKVQRATADKQHESAHKLEKLSQALVEDAAEIKGEMEGEEPASLPVVSRPEAARPRGS